MILTVYSSVCLTCGKGKVKLAALQRIFWNDLNTEIKLVRIRYDSDAREKYYALAVDNGLPLDSPRSIVANEYGKAMLLEDVNETSIKALL